MPWHISEGCVPDETTRSSVAATRYVLSRKHDRCGDRLRRNIRPTYLGSSVVRHSRFRAHRDVRRHTECAYHFRVASLDAIQVLLAANDKLIVDRRRGGADDFIHECSWRQMSAHRHRQ